MSLNVLELVVHHDLHIWGGRNVFTEQRRILFEGLGFDLPDCFAAFGYVPLQLLASLAHVSSVSINEEYSNSRVGTTQALG